MQKFVYFSLRVESVRNSNFYFLFIKNFDLIFEHLNLFDVFFTNINALSAIDKNREFNFEDNKEENFYNFGIFENEAHLFLQVSGSKSFLFIFS